MCLYWLFLHLPIRKQNWILTAASPGSIPCHVSTQCLLEQNRFFLSMEISNNYILDFYSLQYYVPSNSLIRVYQAVLQIVEWKSPYIINERDQLSHGWQV